MKQKKHVGRNTSASDKSPISKETLARLDDALPVSAERVPGSFTRQEYQDAKGLKTTTARTRLAALVKQGILDTCTIYQKDNKGRMFQAPAYVLKKVA